MEINLSNEMIEKITCVAFARVNQLRRNIEEENSKEVSTEREKTVKRIYLKDLEKALSDAKEVHETFLEILEMTENNQVD